MWRYLIYLRAFLPRSLWEPLREAFWRCYWKRQNQVSSQRLLQDDSSIQANVSGSERATLIQAIADFYPFDSLLEIGCGYGQNFHILPKLFPKSHFIGIDINRSRVIAGNELLERSGYAEVAELRHLSAAELRQFPDKGFDILITSAALLYIDSKQIESVCREMLRLSRKAILLLEQNEKQESFSEQHLGRFIAPEGTTPGYWLRDYERLFKNLGCQAVELTKVPKPRWQTESWGSYASLLIVRIQ